MSKKKLTFIFLILFAILSNVLIITNVSLGNVNNNKLYFCVDMESDKNNDFQVYYDKQQLSYTEELSYTQEYNIKDGRDILDFLIEPGNGSIRIDFGVYGSHTIIYEVYYKCSGITCDISLSDIAENGFMNDVSELTMQDGALRVETVDGDSNIAYYFDEVAILNQINKALDKRSMFINIALCIIIDLLIIFVLVKFSVNMEIPAEIFREKRLIATLSKNDFKTRFAGSYMGIAWAFIQPIVTVLVYWFVFEKGLRAGRMCDYPFILWLMCGLVPWFYFADAISGGTNALIEYNYLVKKVVFKISILPFVKVISNLFIHSFFVVFILILHACYGYGPNLYWLQIIYYILCTVVLVLGLSYLTSALVVFFRDLTQIIAIILQIGMWATPIMWDINQFSPQLELIFKLNPVYYIVQGYRNSLLAGTWFWEDMYWTLYFWIIIVAVFMLGQNVFRKLKVHFADVL